MLEKSESSHYRPDFCFFRSSPHCRDATLASKWNLFICFSFLHSSMEMKQKEESDVPADFATGKDFLVLIPHWSRSLSSKTSIKCFFKFLASPQLLTDCSFSTLLSTGNDTLGDLKEQYCEFELHTGREELFLSS